MINDNTTERTIQLGSSVHLKEHNYAFDQNSALDGQTKDVNQPSFSATTDAATNSNWQTVPKRRTHDVQSTRGQKKSKQDPPPSSVIKTQNSFEVLNSVSDNMEDDVQIAQNREPKPPPIFIPNVGNVPAMIRSFESVVATGDFTYKCVNQNSVKVLPNSADIYRKLVRKLNEANISFHTFQLKQERAYRVVLKHMHYSVDTNDVKEALSQLGHTVRNITNVLNKSTKQPLSMFFIDLEPSSNNKDIFAVQYLLHAKVTFEAPYKKKDIVQCKRCQQYGHTKSYCRHPFRCVKCGKDHDSTKCTKDNSTPAACALCGGDHPANYKGCTVFKDIQSRKFPPMREKSTIPMERPTSHSHRRPGLSYAAATSNAEVSNNNVNNPSNAANVQTTENSHREEASNDSLTQTITEFFDRFEKLFMQQSQQIGALLNLLTTVLQKLN